MRTRLDLLVIAALGVYRAWRFIAKDRITERWREQVYNRWPPTYKRALARAEWNENMHEVVMHTRGGTRRNTGKEMVDDKVPKVSWATASVDCPWCLPLLACAALTLAVDASFGLTWPVAWWLALSTAVGLVGRADG